MNFGVDVTLNSSHRSTAILEQIIHPNVCIFVVFSSLGFVVSSQIPPECSVPTHPVPDRLSGFSPLFSSKQEVLLCVWPVVSGYWADPFSRIDVDLGEEDLIAVAVCAGPVRDHLFDVRQEAHEAWRRRNRSKTLIISDGPMGPGFVKDHISSTMIWPPLQRKPVQGLIFQL